MSDEEAYPQLTVDDFKITPDFSPEDYEKNWGEKLCYVEDHDEKEIIFNIFYKHVWNLLFGPEANEETQAKAIALLVIERQDAAFHNPFAYNDWIRTVRDEVIKKKMFEFWQQEIVPKKLGLIWARDSDYFDDMEDPEPARFYKLRDTDPDVVWD